MINHFEWFNHFATRTLLLRFTCTDTMGQVEELVPPSTTFVSPVLKRVEAHPSIQPSTTWQVKPQWSPGGHRQSTAGTAETTRHPSSFNIPIHTMEKCHLLFPCQQLWPHESSLNHFPREHTEITSAVLIERPTQTEVLKAPINLLQQTSFHARGFTNPHEVLELLETIK